MLFLLGLLSSSIYSKEILVLILESLLLLFLGEGKNGNLGTSNGLTNSTTMFEGKYYLESSTNFDAYLYELGVGYILRNLAKLAKPTVTISRVCGENVSVPVNSTDCTWRIYTETPFKSHRIKFTLGEEVGDLTMDGRSTTSLFQVHNDTTLIEFQLGETNTTLVRVFDQDKMQVIMHVNDVTASSVFPRYNSTAAPAAD